MNQPPLFSISLEYISDLPRLAWCAVIQKGSPEVKVKCGSWVEAINNGFTAGAWDGDYAEGRPDLSSTIVGSAMKITNEGVIFCPPSTSQAWLHMVNVGDSCYVSNSLPMILAMTDDGPDWKYPDYYFDLLEMINSGLTKNPPGLPTAKGHTVQIILYHNLQIQADLGWQYVDKPPEPEPKAFEDFRDYLQLAVTKVVQNAECSSRKHPFTVRSTVSSGYDSTAAAVMAAGAGCKEALTFDFSGTKKSWDTDSGKEISAWLGMSTHEYSRHDLSRIQGQRDHEFYMNVLHAATDRCFMVFDDHLEGTLLVTGKAGDGFWSKSRMQCQPGLGRFYWHERINHCTLIEYSLRRGFMDFPIPYIGAMHAMKLRKISRSESMRSWRIGGDYDRPIPRRIAEEAGIEREMFGMKKLGGGITKALNIMSEESRNDMLAYIDSRKEEITNILSDSQIRRRHLLHYVQLKLRYIPIFGPILKILIGYRLHSLWRNQYSYSFHWGLDRMRERYAKSLENS